MSWSHQDSSVADPSPTSVRAEDIRCLCENVIDLRPVHPAMLYTIGLSTIWKHVEYHPVFKDGEGTVVTGLSQFLKFPMAGGIPEKSDHQRVVEYENERVLAAKRKAQAAKDRVAEKRAATEGASQRPKKKKTSPLSFALSDSEADGSPRSGSGTHHSALPLNTIILNEAELTTEGDGLILDSQHSNPSDEDAHNVRDETAHTHASRSTGRVSSSSGGSHHQAFPRRIPGGDGIDGGGGGWDDAGRRLDGGFRLLGCWPPTDGMVVAAEMRWWWEVGVIGFVLKK
uniref:Transposase (Putative), gypsy type n=1 Tax=Tanacetum cinerariifolium TaxID=118510 RepID=A0A6L2LWH9_TANCI|nr:hypothetical protein [Tanacetum cinerariifolium]